MKNTDQAVAEAKKVIRRQEEQFHTIHNDGRFRIFKNPSGELFVEHLKTKVTMRFGHSDEGLDFTTDGHVDPQRVTNMIGWLVHKRR